jgi:hypothetical protein
MRQSGRPQVSLPVSSRHPQLREPEEAIQRVQLPNAELLRERIRDHMQQVEILKDLLHLTTKYGDASARVNGHQPLRKLAGQ